MIVNVDKILILVYTIVTLSAIWELYLLNFINLNLNDRHKDQTWIMQWINLVSDVKDCKLWISDTGYLYVIFICSLIRKFRTD